MIKRTCACCCAGCCCACCRGSVPACGCVS